MTPQDDVGRRPVGADETRAANRSWWDAAAPAYQAEHGEELWAGGLQWGPEGLTEAAAGLLGPLERLRGQPVLEVGCGAGQGTAWLRAQGVGAFGVDLSLVQLRAGRLRGARGVVAGADATRLPVRSASVAAAFSAYGALQFVADADGLLREVARVLRPGGRWVVSLTHPVRWALPDDPGPAGLVVRHAYWDRTPYVEQDEAGRATYVEHHRTIGDLVRGHVAAGLEVRDLVEPEWPPSTTRTWGGWSPGRGALVPGTLVVVARRAATAQLPSRR